MADRAAALGLVLPNRDEKDSTTIEKANGQFFAVNRKTREASPVTQDGQPLVNRADVPVKITVGGQEFTVSQGQGASALATQGQGDYRQNKDAETRARQQQENDRKRSAYESEAGEWGTRESTYRQNKVAEDQAIKAKQDNLQTLYGEKRSWTPQLLGGRSSQEIQSDIDRLGAEIKTHRTNSQTYQRQAEDAAGKATAARRNAGLNAGSPPAQTPRAARPGRIQPSEDPQVRDYANHFFGGDYQKAQAAIQAQRNKK
jgi:hypothetical protein